MSQYGMLYTERGNRVQEQINQADDCEALLMYTEGSKSKDSFHDKKGAADEDDYKNKNKNEILPQYKL